MLACVDVEIAAKYGTNEAFIMNKIEHLDKTLEGKTDGDGVHWIRMTTDEWLKEFPFMSKGSLGRALNHLKEIGFIETRTFKFKSLWYRLASDPATLIKESPIPQNGELPTCRHKSIPQAGEKDVAIPHPGESIPQNEPLIPQNGASIPHSESLPKTLILDSFQESNPKEKDIIDSQNESHTCATIDLDSLWSSTLSLLSGQMYKATFDQWVYPTQLRSLQNGRAVVEARTPQAREWLAGRLKKPIERVLESTAGYPVQIEFSVTGEVRNV